MTTSQEKGDALELAVAAIERVILQNAKSGGAPTFERKKIIKVAGVRHEIDLYLTVDIASGYNAIFIFECKNWQKAVDKNEIIVFIKKIQDSSASIGFFVAKSYTADAKAAAKTDPRVILYDAIEHDPAEEPTELFCRFPHMTSCKINFRPFEAPEQKTDFKKASDCRIKFRGEDKKLGELFYQWTTEACTKEFAAFMENPVPEGLYPQPPVHKVRKFPRGELFLDGREISEVIFYIEYIFEVEIGRASCRERV